MFCLLLRLGMTVIQRMRADGYQVIDKPRARVRDDTLTQNHGGIAAIAFTGGASSARRPWYDT